MTQLFLPDNTVLINFAIISRMDLLAELLNGKGTWCLSISRECANSQPYQPDLAQASAIFGSPLIPDRTEHADALILRDSMASPGDPITKHRGEAETIAIIARRRLNALFLTDDCDATNLAVRHGIKVVTTWDLLRLAYRVNKVTKPVLTGYLRTLKSQRRGHPPAATDPERLDDWL